MRSSSSSPSASARQADGLRGLAGLRAQPRDGARVGLRLTARGDGGARVVSLLPQAVHRVVWSLSIRRALLPVPVPYVLVVRQEVVQLARAGRARPPWRRPRRRQPPPASRAAEARRTRRRRPPPSPRALRVASARRPRRVALDAEAVVVFLRRRGQERPRASAWPPSESAPRGLCAAPVLACTFFSCFRACFLIARALGRRPSSSAISSALFMVTCVSRASVSMTRRNCSSFSTSPLCALFARRRATTCQLVAAVQLVRPRRRARLEQQHAVCDIEERTWATSLINAHARATHSGRRASASSVSRQASACPRSFADKSRAASLTRRARAAVMGVAHVVIIQRALQRGDVRGRAGDPRRRVARVARSARRVSDAIARARVSAEDNAASDDRRCFAPDSMLGPCSSPPSPKRGLPRLAQTRRRPWLTR